MQWRSKKTDGRIEWIGYSYRVAAILKMGEGIVREFETDKINAFPLQCSIFSVNINSIT